MLEYDGSATIEGKLERIGKEKAVVYSQ